VDSEADVGAGADDGLTGVNAHSDPNLMAVPGMRSQGPLGLEATRHGAHRIGEGSEDGVTLGAEQHAAGAGHGDGDQLVVGLEHVGVPVTEPLEETGGSLDVGEHEGHRARRKQIDGVVGVAAIGQAPARGNQAAVAARAQVVRDEVVCPADQARQLLPGAIAPGHLARQPPPQPTARPVKKLGRGHAHASVRHTVTPELYINSPRCINSD
jgi:hypothetical protein